MELNCSGYMLIFLSNESRINVRFDNLQITHYKGKLLEESHYYPYGLTVTTKAFSGTLGNDKLYQGKRLDKEEFSDGTGLSWYDFGARAYDPQVGVWHSYDPLGEQASGLTPYHYCNDNPVVFSDPSGMKVMAPVESNPELDELNRMNAELSLGRGPGGGGGWGGGGFGIDNALSWLNDIGGAHGSFLGDQLSMQNGQFYSGINENTSGQALNMYGANTVRMITNATAVQNILNSAWAAAGMGSTKFSFSNHEDTWGYWATTVSSTEFKFTNDAFHGEFNAAIVSKWNNLDVNDVAGMLAGGWGEEIEGKGIENTKFIGEATHNTAVLALGQGFEAAHKAAPAVEMFKTGESVMKGAGNGLVLLDAGLTVADGLTNPNGWETRHTLDLGADATIITLSLTVPVAGEIFAVCWFVGNIISKSVNGKSLSENIQDGIR